MKFLDEPLDFSMPELRELRNLFVNAYPYEDAARHLAESAGIAAGSFPIRGSNMRSIWTELMKVMSKQGKLRKMIDEAAADESISGYHVRFAEMLQEAPPIPTAGPDLQQGWWREEKKNPGKLHHERLLMQRARLIDIQVARQVGQLARSVAKLTLRFTNATAYGTGFLIQPDLLLTNHHNVSDSKLGEIESITAEFDYEQRFAGEPLVMRALVGSIRKNKELDWAVIQLESPVDRKPIALGSPFDVGKDDAVIIIQHPNGAFKQFALDMLSVRYADNRVIQYVADTQKGSSGSPVFNDRMQVIALHHAEEESTVKMNGVDQTEYRNQGIRIQAVMASLKAEGIPFVPN